MADNEGITERWAPINGFPYEVSDRGRVRRAADGKHTFSGRIIAWRIQMGYPYITVGVRGSKQKKLAIHRLVADAFVPGRSDARKYVNHLNGVKTDNRAENLEWVTALENAAHASRTGLLPRGPAHYKWNPARH